MNRYIISSLFLLLITGCHQPEKLTNLKPLTSENVATELSKFGKENPETIVLISTSMGEIKVKLFNETPLHRANFIRLVKMGFYDKTVFHRVLKNFMVQGGNARQPKMIIGEYGIPNEVKPQFYHKRGALAMARYDDAQNPTRASSADNFYIIQGSVPSLDELQNVQELNKFKYTPDQLSTYLKIGGVPTLDTKYTVFGEVLEGMNVVDKIAAVPVDTQDWPSQEIYITMEVIE